MKISLPSQLRAALLAAILSISTFTLSSAHAAGVAETKEELEKTTLTELNADDPALYPKPSAYQLEEVTGDVELDLFHITKYLYEAGTYTPVQYNVVFDEPLGDEKPDGAEYTYFQWEQDEFTEIWSLKETADAALADIKAYSTKNMRLEHSSGTIDVANSFVDLSHGTGLTESNGGALNNGGTISKLTGDFVSNSALAEVDEYNPYFDDIVLTDKSGSASGGAIYNTGTVTSLAGDFIANSATVEVRILFNIAPSGEATVTSAAQGGAVFNNSQMESIAGDFISNSLHALTDVSTSFSSPAEISSDSTMNASSSAFGGAIYNEGTVTTLTGDFISNTARVEANFDAYIDSRDNYIINIKASAEAAGGAIYNTNTVTSLTGDFISNAVYADALVSRHSSYSMDLDAIAFALGGAIYNTGTVTSLASDFISNSAYATSNADGIVNSRASGGAIHNTSTIGSITGDFISNSAHAFTFNKDVHASGGAIYNEGSIESIRGSFVSNSTLAEDSSYALLEAFGGVIYNTSTIGSITGDFISNSAIAKPDTDFGSTDTRGGAIYNWRGSLGFLALDSSMQFTGNYISSDGGTTKTYEAINNNNGTLRFNSYDTHRIVVNDGIDGDSGSIDINSGLDGAGKGIASGDKLFSTVAFNSFVENQRITVHAGTLVLGEFAGIEGLAPKTAAELINSTLTIEKGARVDAFNASALGEGERISNNGELYIAGGELNRTIAGEGNIYVTADLSASASHLLISSYIDVAEAATLTLDGASGVSITNIRGAGQLHIKENADIYFRQVDIESKIATGASLHISSNEQLSHDISGEGNLSLSQGMISTASISVGGLTLNIGEQGNFGLQLSSSASLSVSGDIIMNYNGEWTGDFDLITWEQGATVMDFASFTDNLRFTHNGSANPWAMATQGGNSYGVTLVDAGPYDPNAGYVLTPTTPAEAGTFTVTTYNYDSSTGTLSSQLNNLEFSGSLGDDPSQGGKLAAAKHYRWESKDSVITLEDVGLLEEGDFFAYSSHNERLVYESINQDVIRSFLSLSHHSEQENSLGGALVIINSSSDIEKLTGDFIANSVSGSGAADSHIIVRGGGIYLSRSKIAELSGDFIYNSAYSSAGAFSKANANGGAIFNQGTIESLKGNFIYNSASGNAGTTAQGGAIFNQGTIGSLKGDFISNSVSTIAHASFATIAWGGAIFNEHEREIGSITGKFISNSASVSSSEHDFYVVLAYGGAIFNEGTITELNSDFMSNSASVSSSTITGEAIKVIGGAIANRGTIVKLTGDFIGNSAVTSAPASDELQLEVQAGAIYNDNASMGLLALNRSMQFTGNFISTDGGQTKTYEAIYNISTQNSMASLHFNAYGEHSIVVNDGISGSAENLLIDGTTEYYNTRDMQFIHINNGKDGSGADIAVAEGTLFSTVEFNNFVKNHSITVHAGTLVLGEFEGMDGLAPASTAQLHNSVLTINAGARVNAYSADALGTGNSISNAGTLAIGAGTLSSSLSGTGHVDLLGSSTVGAGISLATGTLSIHSDGTDAAALTLGVNSTLSLDGELGVILSRAGSYTGLSIDKFIAWDASSSIMDFASYASKLVVYENGVKNVWAYATQTGSAYGFGIADTGEYKADAGYILTESAQSNFRVLTANKDSGTWNTERKALSFDGALGDDFSVSSATPKKASSKQYQWQVDRDTGNRSLQEVDLGAEGDFFAYSHYNERMSGNLAEGQDISRSFLGLSQEGNGGAISLTTLVGGTYESLGNIEGDFIANSTVGDSDGGAIYVYNNETGNIIGNITGHFVGNIARDGGAIATFGANSKIGVITGDFIGNSARSDGGAIYNYTTRNGIDGVNGDFIVNIAQSGHGGAISNASISDSHSNKIGFLNGDFLGNVAYLNGGAIYNRNEIETISGNFVDNIAQGNGGAISNQADGNISSISANFIANSSLQEGAAIYNLGSIGSVSGDFVSNVGQSVIHNAAGGIMTLSASGSDMLIQGNFNVDYSASAIVNEAGISTTSTMTLNATGGGNLVINEIIKGDTGGSARQELIITGDATSKVMINNTVSDQKITVESGVLELGSVGAIAIGDTHELAARNANLSSSSLSIAKNASVIAQTASYLGSQGSNISNQGTLSLGAGTLGRNIRSSNATVNIQGNVDIGSKFLEFSQTVNLLSGKSATRSLSQLEGNAYVNNISLDSNTHLSIEHLTLTEIGFSQQTGSSLSFDNVIFDKRTLNNMSNVTLKDSTLSEVDISPRSTVSFTTSEGGMAETASYTLSGLETLFINKIEGNLTLSLDTIADFNYDEITAFKLNGVKDIGTSYGNIQLIINGERYQVLGATNTGVVGDSDVYLYIPEPSTATLSLLALAGLLACRRRKAA